MTASTWQRLENFVIDSLFFLVFAIVFGMILGLVGIGNSVGEIGSRLLGLVVLIIYYTVQEATTGRKATAEMFSNLFLA